MKRITAITLVFLGLCCILHGQEPPLQLTIQKNILKSTLPADSFEVLDIKNMEMGELLQILSDKMGWTIIASPKVSEVKVNALLKNIKAERVLQIISEVYNIKYQKEGKTIKVMTREEYEIIHGKEKKTISLSHADATGIKNLLKPLSSQKGEILADERTNTLTIIDTQENIQRMENIIKEIDKGKVARIFPLRYADPEQVKKELDSLFPSKSGVIEIDKSNNQIIVTNTPENIKAIEELVKTLDEKMVTKIFPLHYAKPEDFQPILKEMVSKGGGVQVDKRARQLLVTDTPSNMEKIATAIKQIDEKLTTKIFQLNYADPEKIKTQLEQFLPKEEGTLIIDLRTKTISVTAIPKKIEEVEKLVQSWDRKSKEVLIEAKIVEIVLNKNQEFGIDWNVIISAGGASKPTTFPFSESSFPTPAASVYKFGTISFTNLTAVLRALQTQGTTNILSNPRVAVLDGQEARITVGETIPIATYERLAQTGLMEITGYTEKDVGIVLTVTPYINEDLYITMKVKPEISTVLEYRGQFNDIPVLSTRKTETQIMVRNGETIVIGGLISTQEDKSTSKVPFLGDIPALGKLFQNEKTTLAKKELMVFITPHIISDNQPSVAETETEKGEE
ncbi:MAG: secretin N-terminal domain-containing protein [Candidatus Ratteibacteria bacterium]|jgi:type II secretory pathway component GspD/PulD (secretin)